MADLAKIVLLSVVQGLTEFLPISSSGHLGLAQHFLGFNPPGMLFEVTTHVGTLLAVVIYYWRRLLRIAGELTQMRSAGQREALYLVVATVPIGIIGVCFGGGLESLIDSPVFICAMLMATGMILLSLIFARPDRVELTLGRAIGIGVMQALAILPGISRSGTTITAARHLGLAPRTAAEFSLLLMLPAIGGAMVLSIGDVMHEGLSELSVLELATAFVVSALVGYAAIELLVRSLTGGHFKWFGVYCLVVGFFGILLI